MPGLNYNFKLTRVGAHVESNKVYIHYRFDTIYERCPYSDRWSSFNRLEFLRGRGTISIPSYELTPGDIREICNCYNIKLDYHVCLNHVDHKTPYMDLWHIDIHVREDKLHMLNEFCVLLEQKRQQNLDKYNRKKEESHRKYLHEQELIRAALDKAPTTICDRSKLV